jgi:hypothetical protein
MEGLVNLVKVASSAKGEEFEHLDPYLREALLDLYTHEALESAAPRLSRRMSATSAYEYGLSVDEFVRLLSAVLAKERPRIHWWQRFVQINYKANGEERVRRCTGGGGRVI